MSAQSSSGATGEDKRYPDYFDVVATPMRWNLLGIFGGGWFTTNLHFLDTYVKRNPSMCRVLSELYQECVESKGSEHQNCNFFKYKSSLCHQYMEQGKEKAFRAAALRYSTSKPCPFVCEGRYQGYKQCVCDGDFLYRCHEYPRDDPSCFFK